MQHRVSSASWCGKQTGVTRLETPGTVWCCQVSESLRDPRVRQQPCRYPRTQATSRLYSPPERQHNLTREEMLSEAQPEYWHTHPLLGGYRPQLAAVTCARSTGCDCTCGLLQQATALDPWGIITSPPPLQPTLDTYLKNLVSYGLRQISQESFKVSTNLFNRIHPSTCLRNGPASTWTWATDSSCT